MYDVASKASLAKFSDAYNASWSADGRYLLAGSKLIDAASFTVVNDLVRGHLHQLELEAAAEYVDSQRYRVSGQVRIDGGEAIDFTG